MKCWQSKICDLASWAIAVATGVFVYMSFGCIAPGKSIAAGGRNAMELEWTTDADGAERLRCVSTGATKTHIEVRQAEDGTWSIIGDSDPTKAIQGTQGIAESNNQTLQAGFGMAAEALAIVRDGRTPIPVARLPPTESAPDP